MPASAPNLPTNHPGKLFRIVYITLTGAIDTMIPAAGLWSWLPSCGGHCPQKTRPKLPLKTMGQPPKTGSLKVRIIVHDDPTTEDFSLVNLVQMMTSTITEIHDSEANNRNNQAAQSGTKVKVKTFPVVSERVKPNLKAIKSLKSKQKYFENKKFSQSEAAKLPADVDNRLVKAGSLENCYTSV
ncbi:hypothetical protein DSO57_1005077 [Entomophthora muscae]|uniref:Uncharacterized protein n=1 Tax=Entomophthora muscae TaxID=34485 RepID=A0ACC2RMQ5_9FUNG|nr:hypothetical protein DSO57_1005077 [Entomophthora muscae]